MVRVLMDRLVVGEAFEKTRSCRYGACVGRLVESFDLGGL